MQTKTSKKLAFSLIELIFVIVIIGVISSIAVPKLFDTKTKALVSTIKKDISTITSSVQSYSLLNGGISRFSDAVNLNENNWKITDTELNFLVDESNCVTITLTDSTLKIDIESDNKNEICENLYKEGVRSTEYDLF